MDGFCKKSDLVWKSIRGCLHTALITLCFLLPISTVCCPFVFTRYFIKVVNGSLLSWWDKRFLASLLFIIFFCAFFAFSIKSAIVIENCHYMLWNNGLCNFFLKKFLTINELILSFHQKISTHAMRHIRSIYIYILVFSIDDGCTIISTYTYTA